MSRTKEDKFKTVIEKNTFYFFNQDFEETYEGYLNSLKEILLNVKNRVETEGLRKEIFENLLLEKEYGLIALLALTGFSNEYFKRLITMIRIVDNRELNNLAHKEKWCEDINPENISEWSDSRIRKLIKNNQYFRKGIVNIFFEGSSIPFLSETIPLFELKKLSISKLKFELPEMIDTIVRYKEKGSYSGKKGNNAETCIKEILNKNEISFESGDLKELIDYAADTKRTMDFIIPDKNNPQIIIESSFLSTTSSGQGDKAKTEISIKNLIKEHYPKAVFIGFVDGIGWYVRKKDLERHVTAYEDVFTFHKDELLRFEIFISKVQED